MNSNLKLVEEKRNLLESSKKLFDAASKSQEQVAHDRLKILEKLKLEYGFNSEDELIRFYGQISNIDGMNTITHNSIKTSKNLISNLQ